MSRPLGVMSWTLAGRPGWGTAHLRGMDPRSRRRAQAVTYDGRHMPTGSAGDRLCDLDGCPRGSETLVAAADGSVLLVCTSCATQMSSANGAAGGGMDTADDTADDTAEFPAIRDEVAAPVPVAEVTGSARTARRGWWFWVRLVLGVVFSTWGAVLLGGDASTFDGVVTAAFGVYVLLDLARPRYQV